MHILLFKDLQGRKQKKNPHLRSVELLFSQRLRFLSVCVPHPETSELLNSAHKNLTAVTVILWRTHLRRVAKAFDGLEDAASYGPHGESPPAVIHYPPGTELARGSQNVRTERSITEINSNKKGKGHHTLQSNLLWR